MAQTAIAVAGLVRALSVNFLAAHGLSPDEGWGAFTSKKEMIFMKLIKEKSRFGLKSP